MIAIGRLMLALLLATGLTAGTSQAGTLVEFPDLAEHSPERLLGYLARPDGAGPFPAVLVLHGCGGFSSGGSLQLADRLSEWGYAGLMVDSFGPRGMTTACGGSFSEQPSDAHAALKFLSRQPFVVPDRVAVLGNSMGGYSALAAVDRDLIPEGATERFCTAIAYYPNCGIPAAMMTAPALILIGEADDWTPAERCRQMVAHARPDGAPIALTTYPGAHHGFNFAMLKPGRGSLGHWLEYDEAAAKDAEAKIRDFLAVHLGHAAAE